MLTFICNIDLRPSEITLDKFMDIVYVLKKKKRTTRKQISG